ncbi:metal-binding protein [Chania multitudinisentens RB-25]|uniref:Metal-binding protein n=1 Tax=Chania multitudinisentens RB-25 TaxID=1441930 RepID=W0L3M1_9GAMM|nr:VOC family protein [Chania multitudinisentens]AHG18353.1 metal-binding protein [Chania multitudinisentens RB-25]
MLSLPLIAELNDLVQDLPRFEQALLQFAEKLHLDLSQFSADHISLRCHQNSTAERWRQGLAQCGTVLSDAIINGRPIYLFDLAVPIKVGPWQIDCVELPYPGDKRYPHEGWEHIELVLSGDPATLYARALNCLADEALLLPGIKLKQSAPKGEGERLPNPTLAITDGNITIKFHPYSIRDIIASERA